MSNSKLSEIAETNVRKRFKKNALTNTFALVISLVFGIAITFKKDGVFLMPHELYVALSLLFIIFVYGLTYFCYKSMDEFEKRIFNEAGNIAFHSGFLGFAWLFFSETALLPELKAVILLLGMAVVFNCYYYGKKILS